MISIHQSQFLSWSPFYYKAIMSDTFVVLDDVQFQKNGVQNRNLIKTPQGELWLTIPLKQHNLDTPINKIFVSNVSVYEKILKTIEMSYKKCSSFDGVFRILEGCLSPKNEKLHDLNNELFLDALKFLDSHPKLFYSSQMDTVCKKDDLVIELIKKTGDNEYLSGSGALSYMNLDKFKKESIKVYVYKFNYSPYKQLWDNKVGFIGNLSIIDLLFNEHINAKKYLLENGSISRII